MEEKDINLFHKYNTEREIIPNKYLFKNYINIDLKSKTFFKPLGNLTKNQEDQIMFSNDLVNEIQEELINSKTRNKRFEFKNIINIDKNKIMTYFICNNYEEFFSLFELYIKNIFNGYNLDIIPILLENNLITEEIFASATYCINIIKFNKKCYEQIFFKNNNNKLKTTEIILKIKNIEQDNPKLEALFLILKFIELLKNIDENSYNKEIEKLNEIFEKNNNSN